MHKLTIHNLFLRVSFLNSSKKKNQIIEISKIHNNKNIPRSIHIN